MAGTASVKVLEFEDFESIPTMLSSSCSIFDLSSAAPNDCDKYFGWRSENGKLDSGKGVSGGIFI